MGKLCGPESRTVHQRRGAELFDRALTGNLANNQILTFNPVLLDIWEIRKERLWLRLYRSIEGSLSINSKHQPLRCLLLPSPSHCPTCQQIGAQLIKMWESDEEKIGHKQGIRFLWVFCGTWQCTKRKCHGPSRISFLYHQQSQLLIIILSIENMNWMNRSNQICLTKWGSGLMGCLKRFLVHRRRRRVSRMKCYKIYEEGRETANGWTLNFDWIPAYSNGPRYFMLPEILTDKHRRQKNKRYKFHNNLCVWFNIIFMKLEATSAQSVCTSADPA